MESDQIVKTAQSELLVSFNKNGVRYFVVGGSAVRAYCPERDFGDFDILIDRDSENIGRLNAALQELGDVPCVIELAAEDKACRRLNDFLRYDTDLLFL